MLSKPGIFDSQSAATASRPLDDYLQPTLSHGLRVWWAYFWPTQLSAIFIAAVGAGSLLIAWQDVKISGYTVIWGDRFFQYVPAYIISIFTIRYILGKRFRHFRIALLSLESSSPMQPLPRTMARTLRVWWAFVWRSVVGAAIGFVVVILPLSWFIGLFNPNPIVVMLFGLLVGSSVNALISIYIVYSAVLDEQFGDFRIALLPRKDVAPVAPAIAPSPALSRQR